MGVLTGSANRPRLRRRNLRNTQPESSATTTASSRETSLPPPTPSYLGATPGLATVLSREIIRRAPAHAEGYRVRAAAWISFIGFSCCHLPSLQPALSFFNALFSRPFLPSTAFPLLPAKSGADVLTPAINFIGITNWAEF